MSNVAINIAAEFTGKKAFTDATKSTKTLEQSASNLAKVFRRTFAVTAVLAYGRASVKAFAADEAAAQRLSTAVANLGYSFSQTNISDFISNLERTSGVLDDQLRPAFQALLTTTGSLTQSQKLLNDAIQISRASGEDLLTVSNDLALAYTGNTKGLKKYYTGLTQAELKSMSFSEVLGVMLKNSAGAAEAYLGTAAYKMNVLSVASENAKEKIGAGLVDAFAKIGGGTSAEDAAHTIDNIAKAILGIVDAIATVIGAFTKFYRKIDEFSRNFDPIFGDSWNSKNKPKTGRSSSPAGTWKRMQEQKKAELEAIKRNRELAALAKKQADAAALAAKKKQEQAQLDKAALMLAKGEDVFNLDAIQIQAALTNQTEQLGKVTNQTQLLAIANDTARLRVKKDILDLEKAIQDGDADAATAAAEKLNTDLKTLGALQGQAIKLADINKILAGMMPKDLINIANLNIALEKIKEINKGLGGSSTSANWIDVAPNAGVDTIVAAAENNAQFLLDLAAANEQIIAQINANPVNVPAAPQITNYFGGSVVTDQKLIDMVLSGAQLSSLSGSPSQIGRIAGMFS
jgi:hypothetical protein